MGGKIKSKIKKIKVKTWQLLLVLIPLFFLLATFFRIDYLQMSSLRNEVIEADKEGNEEEVIKKLQELSNFTNSHIIINIVENNGKYTLIFGTGPFYLEESYRRAAAEAIEKAENEIIDDSNPNGNVYSKAGSICKERAIKNGWSYGQAYRDCMLSEINKYPSAENLVSTYLAQVPSTEIYRIEYLSPIWTFSFSGITLVICILLSVVIFIRFFIWVIIRLSLLVIEKKH